MARVRTPLTLVEDDARIPKGSVGIPFGGSFYVWTYEQARDLHAGLSQWIEASDKAQKKEPA